MPGKATGTVRGVTQPQTGEARIEVTDRWMPCYVQVQLRTESGRGLNFIYFEIFAWDRLASWMYAATATTFLMKMIVSFWNLTGNLTAQLPKCLSNFRMIAQLWLKHGSGYLARGLYVTARLQQERRAGEGDSRNSSMLSRRNHSTQSSLETQRLATHTCNTQ